MADEDVLSDEEIEALLDEGEEAPAGADEAEDGGIDPDRIEEVYGDLSESIEKILTTILNREVSNRLIRSEIQDRQTLEENLPEDQWVVVTSRLGGEEGLARYLLPQDDALLLADVMMGQEGQDPPEEFDEVYMSAIVEMFNQVVNSFADNLNQLTGVPIEMESPEGEIHTTEELLDVLDEDEFLWVEYELSVNGLVDSGVLFEFQPVSTARAISSSGGEDAEPSSDDAAEQDPQTPSGGESAGEQSSQQPTPQAQGEGKKDVKSVEFPQFDTTEGEKPVGNLNMLMDVPMEVAVELGRTTLQVKEILNLGQGSIIELERLAGEPVDLLVNGRLVARGEVVVIDENFGVRVTSIVSPMERIK